MNRLVTLTTDFGIRDSYVAAMKGVMLSLVRDLQIVDVTHEIAPQDVACAAYQISTLMGLFPPDAIHVVVVDPGVGSDRQALVLHTDLGTFVAPDNGVLTPALIGAVVRDARVISNPQVMQPTISSTFHGRDVFAPAAAHLALGEPLSHFGPPIESPVRLSLWDVEGGDGWVRGQIVHIDRFGNAITNLSRADLPAGGLVVTVGSTRIGLSQTYSDADDDQVLALIGSQDTVEVSVNGGNAHERLLFHRGDAVEVRVA